MDSTYEIRMFALEVYPNFGVGPSLFSQNGSAQVRPFDGMTAAFSSTTQTHALGFMPGAYIFVFLLFAVGKTYSSHTASGWTSPMEFA